MRGVTSALVASVLLAAACTQVLSIDGDYVVVDGGSGGRTGFNSVTGGDGGQSGGQEYGPIASDADAFQVGGSGGLLVEAGEPPDAEAPCPSGQKRCGGNCVAPDPSVGCDLLECAICPFSPANGIAICVNEQCDVECRPGFVRNELGTGCDPEPAGTGGGGGVVDAGSSGGTVGISTSCTDSTQCPPCNFIPGPTTIIPGCCNFVRRCGCLYLAACI